MKCQDCGAKIDGNTLCDPCVERRLAAMAPPKRDPRTSIPDQIRDYDPQLLPEDAQRFLTEYQGQDGDLLLYGPTGAGKSYSTAAVALRRIEAGRPIKFVTGYELKETLRPTDDRRQRRQNTQLIRNVRACPWLVIDDLGHGRWSEAYAELLLTIIDERGAKSTVITSQWPVGEWSTRIAGDRPAETMAAIVRRLDDYYACWSLTGQ